MLIWEPAAGNHLIVVARRSSYRTLPLTAENTPSRLTTSCPMIRTVQTPTASFQSAVRCPEPDSRQVRGEGARALRWSRRAAFDRKVRFREHPRSSIPRQLSLRRKDRSRRLDQLASTARPGRKIAPGTSGLRRHACRAPMLHAGRAL